MIPVITIYKMKKGEQYEIAIIPINFIWLLHNRAVQKRNLISNDYQVFDLLEL